MSKKIDLGQDVVGEASKVQLNKDMYKLANEQNLTFSQLLERINPTKPTDTLDAFSRQLKRFGIVTKNDLNAGVYATTIENALNITADTYDNQPLQRDVPESKILFPELVSRTARMALLKDQDYNLDDLISTTRVIPTTTYKEFWIDMVPGQQTQPDLDKYAMSRTSEFGTFPRVKIGWAESAKTLFKRGVQIDMSYEFQREATLDILGIVIDRIMLSQRTSLFKKAISKAINGTAAVKASTLSSGLTAGQHKLNYEAWLKWTASFAPYVPSTYYCHINTALKILMMDKPDIDPVQIMAMLSQGPVNQNIQVSRGLWKNVTIFPFTDNTLPENFVLTLDKRYALERVIQAGTDLQETERIITQQFTSIVISISDEISKIFDDAIFMFELD
jgi:hypothetical protein